MLNSLLKTYQFWFVRWYQLAFLQLVKVYWFEKWLSANISVNTLRHSEPVCRAFLQQLKFQPMIYRSVFQIHISLPATKSVLLL